MQNFIIIPDKKYRFNQKPILGNSVLPMTIPDYLLTGTLHYKFNNQNYQTLSNIYKELTLVLLNQKEYYIGLRYDTYSFKAPMILVKGSNVDYIIEYCKDNHIHMVHNVCLTKKLNKYKKYDFIPEETYEPIARIISEGIKIKP